MGSHPRQERMPGLPGGMRTTVYGISLAGSQRPVTQGEGCDDQSRRQRCPVSAAVKLIGFVLLLVVVFAGARLAGAQLGPVTTSQSQTGGSPGSMHRGGSGSMNMGGQP